MGSERRRAKRFQVVDLDVQSVDTDQKIGKVVNLSEGGLLMIADSELPQQEITRFRIPFSHTVNGEINFEFNARVVWCYPNALQASKFSVGLEFSENPDLQTIFIQQMIKVYGSEQG
jgi:hypothetical protein